MIIISYSSGKYYEHMEEGLHWCCERFKIQHVRYSEEDFQNTRFYTQHKDIADQKRLAGYCIWKPHIIAHAMTNYWNEDLFVYCDASVVFETDPHEFCQSVKNIACGMTSFPHSHWTKRDAFVLMNCDAEECWHMSQVWAGVIIARKVTLPFIEEYEHWCTDPRIITDMPNTMGLANLPGFVDHRHDQSILTNMKFLYPSIIEALYTPFHDYDCK